MNQIRPTLVFLILLSLRFGGIYPFVSTKMVQAASPSQAQGSLLIGKDGKPHGSALIGQNFSEPKYFWGRLSATAPYAYNAAASTGSNYGSNNPALLDAAKARISALKAADSDNVAPIPIDLVMPEQKLRGVLDKYTEHRQFGILGEPRVNVLKLNLALDGKL